VRSCLSSSLLGRSIGSVNPFPIVG
jgi:hypothetical protein